MNPYMVSNTITYSDGTTTVINYDANGNQVAIEQAVAAAVAEPVSEEVAEESIETPSL